MSHSRSLYLIVTLQAVTLGMRSGTWCQVKGPSDHMASAKDASAAALWCSLAKVITRTHKHSGELTINSPPHQSLVPLMQTGTASTSSALNLPPVLDHILRSLHHPGVHISNCPQVSSPAQNLSLGPSTGKRFFLPCDTTHANSIKRSFANGTVTSNSHQRKLTSFQSQHKRDKRFQRVDLNSAKQLFRAQAI